MAYDDVSAAVNRPDPGGTPIPMEVAHMTMRQRAMDARRNSVALTDRQAQVLQLIVEGRTTAAIAATMQISRSTVEHHKQAAFRRLGARNLAHAVAIAVRHNIVSSGHP